MTAVSTWDARGVVTPQVQEDLMNILHRVLKLESRDARVVLLKKVKASHDIHSDTKTFLQLTATREHQHFQFMTVLIPKVFKELQSTADLPHDYSKDEFFCYAAASFFDGGITNPEMKHLADSELRRHHELEPHHPEHEMYTETECSDDDIIEMALDRLSRNAQFGDGVIRLDSMELFKPKFTKGNIKRKEELFWKSVVEYQSLVQREFYNMFPETRGWKGHQIN